MHTEQLTSLITARRLLLRSEQLEARRKNPKAHVQSAKEALEEDQLLLSGKIKPVTEKLSTHKTDQDVRIKLSDLTQWFRKHNCEPGETGGEEKVRVRYARREINVSISYKALAHVEGLDLVNRHLAETDRYAFEFQDGTTFKIIDKWSGKSTTIWGDPHVDTSDQEGNLNGEFSDLKESETHTTMLLEDGTRVTFTAHDQGVIEKVDIFKGSQHLVGIGAASSNWSKESALFSGAIDTISSSSVPLGDVVYAGGDGNDWYDALGRLVWGETTGHKITERPNSVMEVKIFQRVQEAYLEQFLE